MIARERTRPRKGANKTFLGLLKPCLSTAGVVQKQVHPTLYQSGQANIFKHFFGRTKRRVFNCFVHVRPSKCNHKPACCQGWQWVFCCHKHLLLLPTFLLVFAVKPTLSATTTPVQVLQGNPALLAVTVQDLDQVNPSLAKDNFVWTFEGTQQSTTNILENGNLRLTSVQPSQTGSYTCTAVNSAGSGSTTVRLEVLGEIIL